MNGYASSTMNSTPPQPKQETLAAVLGQTKGNLCDLQSELAMICQYLDGPTQEKQLTEAVQTPMGAVGVSFDMRSHSSRLLDTARYIRSRIAE